MSTEIGRQAADAQRYVSLPRHAGKRPQLIEANIVKDCKVIVGPAGSIVASSGDTNEQAGGKSDEDTDEHGAKINAAASEGGTNKRTN